MTRISKPEDSLTLRLATAKDADALKRHRITCGLGDISFSPEKELVILATPRGSNGSIVGSVVAGFVNSQKEMDDFLLKKKILAPHFPVVATKSLCALGMSAMNSLRREVLRAAQRLSAAEQISVERSPAAASVLKLVEFGYRVDAIDVDHILFDKERISVRMAKQRFLQSMRLLDHDTPQCDWQGPPLFSDWLLSPQ